MGTDATARSIPEVVLWLFGKAPDVNICVSAVFPTPLSPSTATFALSTTPLMIRVTASARALLLRRLAYSELLSSTRPSLLDDFFKTGCGTL